MNESKKNVFDEVNEKLEETEETRWEKFKRGGKKLAKAAWDNKQYIVPLVVTGISGAITIGQMVQKRGHVKTEERLKNNYIYDRSAGHYVEATRKVSGEDWLQIDQRRDNGEKYSEILNDMGLLKK